MSNQKQKNLMAVESALTFLKADDRDLWAKCGMAIKSEFREEGFYLWDRWSKTSTKYSANDTKAQWDSFKKDKTGKSVGIATILFYAMKNGYKNDCSYKPINLTPEERNARAKEISDLLAIEKEKRAAAAKKAKEIWESAEPYNLNAHRYVIQKKIEPYCTKYYQGNLNIGGMNCNGALMLPMTINGEISSLQFISSDGEKRLLPGGAKGILAIEELNTLSSENPICICEGYATGVSIHQATRYPVVLAFDEGSLVKTAKEIRAKYPDRKIIMCADNDESGVGLKSATNAAEAVGAYVALPESMTHQNVISPPKDFNDFAQDDGLMEVKLSIDSAKLIEKTIEVATNADTAEQQFSSSQDVDDYAPKVKLTRASDATPEAIKWIWDGWLAGGKFHILGGQAGTGKTTIAINLAAIISKGGRFPDGKEALQGNVLIWSGEDSINDTLVPRLMAAGADRSKIYFIEGFLCGKEYRDFHPATDISELEDVASEVGDVSLIIVDPVVSAITGDSHKNAEVRNALKPLVDLGEKLGCAVLGITHFTKGTSGGDPLERITGSLAFGAVARVVLVAGKQIERDENGEEVNSKRFFCRAKSNHGFDSGGFEYELLEKDTGVEGIRASTVGWIEEVDGSARELLTDIRSKNESDNSSELEDAINFIEKLLADGPLPSTQAQLAAENAGYSKATIRRARASLGVKTRKSGMGGGWSLMLPKKKVEDVHHDVQGDQPSDMSIFEGMNTFDGNKDHTYQLGSGHAAH